MPLGDNRYLLFGLFLAGVAFILLAPVFWLHSEAPAANPSEHGQENADLYHRIYPSFHYGFGRLREGELPLWNPWQYCGAPYLADPANGVFQPLNALFLFLATERAMAVHAFLGLFLMGLFFVLCARAFDVHWVPAFFGAIAYAFSGASASIMSRPDQLNAMVWFPFLVWTLREFTREGRLGYALLGGLGGGLLLVSGSVALSIPCAVFAFAYMMFHGLARGETPGLPPRKRIWQGFFLAACFGLLISAAQSVPAIYWYRSLDVPREAFWRLHLAGETPARLRDLLSHWLMAVATPDTLPRVAYMGIGTLILLPAAFFHRGARKDVVFFSAAVLILAPAAVFGQHIAGGDWPWAALFFPSSFCLAALAAVGADRLLSAGRDPRSPLVWGPVLLALAIAVVVFLVSAAPTRGRLVLTILALIPVLIVRTRWLGAACGLILSGLLFVDLYSASANYYSHPFLDASSCYSAHAKMLKSAQEQAVDGRVFVAMQPLDRSISPNLGMVMGIRAAGGFEQPLPKDMSVWWRALIGQNPETCAIDSPLLNYMAVKVMLTGGECEEAAKESKSRWRPTYANSAVAMFANDSALPRAYWTPRWRAVRNVEEAITVLTAPEFDGARECAVQPPYNGLQELTAMVPAISPAEGPTWQAAPCSIRDETPERVAVSLQAPQPGIVVLSDAYAAGWQVHVDGKPARLLKTNGVFRGVAVSSGPHELVFVYRPWPVWIGLGITCLALMAWAAAGSRIALRRAS